MPQYPHRPIVQALDRLAAQMKRVADALDTPAEEVDAALPPDNGHRVTQWVQPLPGTEEHAQAFQGWLAGVTDVRAATENMTELARVKEQLDIQTRKAGDLAEMFKEQRRAIDRVRAVPKSSTRSDFNAHANAQDDGWDQALDAVHAALRGPAADPTPHFQYQQAWNGWMWLCRCGEADGPFEDEADAATSARADHPDCSAQSPAEVRARRSKPTP